MTEKPKQKVKIVPIRIRVSKCSFAPNIICSGKDCTANCTHKFKDYRFFAIPEDFEPEQLVVHPDNFKKGLT